MIEVTYDKLEDATKVFGLIGLETRDDIKKRYLKLSKIYHPDMQDGNTQKFQELTQAYKILLTYMDNFKFRFSKEEFKNQYPFLATEDKQWSLW